MSSELTPEHREALLDVVQRTFDYAIFLLDAQGRILTWNAGAQRIKGYAPDEVIGKHFSVFYAAEDVASHKPEYELRVAAAEGRYEDTGWRLRKDGRPFWANVILVARRDPSGRLLGYAKITRDVTESKRAEDAIRASEERYRILVDSVKDYAIFLLDAAGRVRTWNSGAQWIKGYDPAEIIGENFARFYPPESREAGVPQRLLARAAEEGRVEDEGWRIRKDGTRFWADVVITAIYGEDGALAGFSKVTRDLSERREGQMERADLHRRAREQSEANSQLEAFSYTVAHDLRAPIRAVASLAEFLMRDHSAELSPDARETVERMRATTARMGALVEDLLNFSRADRGEVRQEEVDIGKMVHHIVANSLQRRDPSRAGDLVLDEDLIVWGDKNLLRIVMDNLLSNAWKFTSTRPRYRIEVRRLEGDAVDTVTVLDNGVGFPPERSEEMFQPFRRLHDARDFPGTGIGLATVRRIVERHGGRVWAETRPAGGAALSFTLPRGPA